MDNYYFNNEGYPDPTAFKAIKKADKKPYRPLVYICSPYAGDIAANVSNAQRYCRFAVDSGCTPIAPHLLFPQFMDDSNNEERKLGLFFGIVLLSKCKEVWVFGDTISSGMQREIDYAKRRNTPIKYFTNECTIRDYPYKEVAINSL